MIRHNNPFDRPPARTLRGPISIGFYDLEPERVFVAEPRGRPVRGNILFVHGLTDHAARQFNNLLWLSELGYRTISFELRGHGGREAAIDETWWLKQAYFDLESRPREVIRAIAERQLEDPRLQLTVRATEYATLTETDVADHFRQCDRVLNELTASRWNAGEPPLFFMGHSLGGLVCIETARRWRRRGLRNLEGVVLLTPALRPNGRPGRLLESLAVDAVWEARRFPAWPPLLLTPFLPVALLRPASKAILTLNFPFDTTWGKDYLTDDRDENDLVYVDPLVLRATPSSYASSIEDQMVCTDKDGCADLPATLLVIPAEDGIVDVRGSLRFAERATHEMGGSFELIRYSHLRAHDLLRSSVAVVARRAIAEWLGKRIGAEGHAEEPHAVFPRRVA